MRFLTFLKSLPAQPHTELQSFIDFAKKNKKFPLSSDPRFLGLFLHNKLNEKLTLGYMQAMIIYYHDERNMLSNELREKSVFLNALNCIVHFQNEGIAL